jgi:hypothetical protein
MGSLRFLSAILLSAGALAAAEHHGFVKFGGLPVPGATVTATQGDKKFTAISDPQGFYSFADLPDGLWTVEVDMLCFVPMKREIAVVANAPTTEWDLKLLPFDQIKAQAPPPSAAPPAVTTSIAPNAPATQASAAVSAKPEAPADKNKKRGKKNGTDTAAAQVQPQTGFQRTDVNATAEGARAENEGAAANPGAGDNSLAPSEGFLINGSVNNGAASPFAQSAAFGNFRRGMRSLYTGGVGFMLGNAAFDARPFSITGQDTPKPDYTHIVGMASFGGPLKLPHLFKQSYPNFFVNYQWTRNRNVSTQPGLMPTAAERVGDLSKTVSPSGQPVQMVDPANGLPFPGNVIPESRISPQARYLMGLYPMPNFASPLYNYQVPIAGANHQDALQTRLNKTVGRKNQLAGSFALQSTRADNPSLFGFLDNTDSLGLNTSATWRHTFKTGIFGTFSYYFSRMSSRTIPYFANEINVSGAAGITGNNQEPVNWGPPNLSFSSGISGLSDAQYSSQHIQTSGVNGSIFWAHRSHNITMGGDFRRQQFNFNSQQNARGSFVFTGAATQATANGLPVAGTGSDIADFLLGTPDTSSIAYGNADKYFRSANYSAYFSDDWRFSSGLTINMGLRWEYGSPATELYGRLVNLDIAPYFTAEAPVVANQPVGAITGQTYPSSLVRPDKNAIQPRLALAWRPLLASSLVIRAGWGIYYNSSFYLPIAMQMAQQSPLSKSLSVANSLASPLTLANGFIAAPGITPNTFAVDPGFRSGYAQTWNVSVQRDLPYSLIMTVNYLGTKGTHEQQAFLPNTWPAGAGDPCPACPSGFAYLISGGNSTRHSGQLQLRRRLHNGLTATLQYTYAHAIDNGALGGRGQGGNLIAQNWLDLEAERARSNFDQRHLATLQMQYTTGMGIGGGTLMGGWTGGLFKDWTFATQITAGTGLPLSPLYVSAVRGTGVTGPLRPDYTGLSLYDAPPGLNLNPAAVATPAAGQWGNAGRNSITGPSQFLLNASMARTFRLSDRLNADFRIDANNVLNHVTYPSWNTTLGSAQFGLPMSANAMRTMLMTMRVRF